MSIHAEESQALQADASTRLLLKYPADGAKLYTNTPVLAWEPAISGNTWLWIDGNVVEKLGSGLHSYVPFPLSYGIHEWYISSDDSHGQLRSESRHFIVEGAPLDPLPSDSLLLREGWSMQSSFVDDRNGAVVSKSGVLNGFPTSVPATTMSVLVRNGVYPNPYLYMNNMLIPDAHDGFNEKYDLLKYGHIPGRNPWTDPYWFVRQFDVDSAWSDKEIHLVIGEINYRAEVWLNGDCIATRDELVGMERSFDLLLPKTLLKTAGNVLAILIFPLDVPGEPASEPIEALSHPGRNMGQDGMIAHNYTKWDALGWDWQPAIRDRDVGIIGDVYLYPCSALKLKDLQVTSVLADDYSTADIRVRCDVEGLDDTQTGTLSLKLTDPDGNVVETRLPLESAIQMGGLDLSSADLKALHLEQPELWWPIHYGDPNLYQLELTLASENLQATVFTHFGIRKVETRMLEGSRVFTINGRDLFIRGGNWVMDMTLNSTAERYEREIELTRRANLNLLRVWGPTGVPPQAFFDAADKAGILIQQDFLNDFWGTGRNGEGMYPDLDVFQAASIDIVKRLRNHPSIVIWCGGNEGLNPRNDWIVGELLPRWDEGGGRYFLESSNGDGLQGGGPYNNLPPEQYEHHPKITGFNSEIGPSGVPVFESLHRFLPVPPREWVPSRFPLDKNWTYHDATNRQEGDDRKFTFYDDILRNRFGAPASEDITGFKAYAEKAQMLNYDTYQSIIEWLNRQVGSTATGYSFWKSNSSWPSVTWQIYDWFEQTHAGYYATRKANWPIRVQLSRVDHTLTLVNLTTLEDAHTNVRVRIDNVDGNTLWKHTFDCSLKANSVTSVGEQIPSYSDAAFVKLELVANDGRVIADNQYAIAGTEPLELPHSTTAQLEVKVERFTSEGKSGIRGTLHNTGATPIYPLRMQWVDAASGEVFLPTYWSDNFLLLLGGETVTVEAEIPAWLESGKSLLKCSISDGSRDVRVFPVL